MHHETLVSIIIPTCNSEKTIEQCIKSVTAQTFAQKEIVVVDNHSRDATRKIAESLGATVFVTGPERTAQMNLGAKMAHGEYVYFIGSDFVLHPNVIEECVAIAKKGYDAIIVQNISDPTPGRWAKSRFYERLSYNESNLYEAARFVKKNLFLKLGGFDEDIYANEDFAFQKKLLDSKVKIGRICSTYEIHVGEPKNLKEIVMKSFYYGGSLGSYFQKYRNFKQALPIRPTFFRKKFLRKVMSEWPQGLLLIPFIKSLQASLSLLGWLSKPKFTPYENTKKRA